MDTAALAFPFAVKAYAAAAAEEAAAAARRWGRADLLARLDSDTLVLREPQALLLEREQALGCRPIHHLRIGPLYDAPLDPFWRLIYDLCGVSEDRTFLMHTAVDGDRIGPHINARLLVGRPERGGLTAWRDTFARVYRQPDCERFYAQDVRYRIFVHQAILSVVALSRLEPQEFLVTCRYDGWGFFEAPGWQQAPPIEEPLQRWLVQQVSAA
jgi:hypothetical protein